jgi:hypothetical protein
VLFYEIPLTNVKLGGVIWIHGGGNISSDYTDMAADVAQDAILISTSHNGMSKQWR